MPQLKAGTAILDYFPVSASSLEELVELLEVARKHSLNKVGVLLETVLVEVKSPIGVISVALPPLALLYPGELYEELLSTCKEGCRVYLTERNAWAEFTEVDVELLMRVLECLMQKDDRSCHINGVSVYFYEGSMCEHPVVVNTLVAKYTPEVYSSNQPLWFANKLKIIHSKREEAVLAICLDSIEPLVIASAKFSSNGGVKLVVKKPLNVYEYNILLQILVEAAVYTYTKKLRE